ncbi:TolC family protein [Limnoraphis robusta Tam1]|uniref:TolC family protein n=1 Tax=Limnoraphis robusta TaxID=1118279 RepID=UPI002B20E829|nr:TolC family protein [Limnoraphis robusta]MEA5538463.1 TolC family protein [Limnoraphis robusta Tam1]
MPVFHNLMAVGVSGAITFTYLGQGIAVPVSVESTEKTSTENSISQRSFKQNLAKSQSAQSTADAAQAKNQPSELLHQPSQADSDPLEASWKENPTKPSQRRILNRLTPSTGTEKLTLNKAESSVQRAFKQNPVKPTPTNSTAQRSILNHFTTGRSQTPTVENSQSSGETVFKENPTKPTQTNSTAQQSILNHFTTSRSQTPKVENSQSSGETVFKENPTKPTQTSSIAQQSIVNHFTTSRSQTPKVENSQSSGETVFKENPTKPTPTDSTVQRILNKFIYPKARNRPTVEHSEPTEETVFKENPVKPSASNPSPIPSALNPSNSSKTASQPQSPNPVEVSLTENREKSSNPTPNLFELSQMLPQPPGANLPPQIAQETNTPTLEVPNLSPPNEPYPQPTPSGILETNPPPITFPSSNPLYRPNQPRDVEIQETVPITLPQAVDLARRNNEGIRVFELQVEQNLAALRSAQADLYPTLAYISTLTRSFSAGSDIANSARNREVEARATPEQAISLSRTYGVTTFENTFQLQYDFDLSGARGARIRAAEEQLRLARLEFERSVEQLRLDVTEAYYNLQEADAEVEIQRAAVRNSQKSLEDAEALERAGVGTRFEVLQARVTLSRVQQDLTNAISNQRTRRRELANILNVSQNVNLIAADAISLAGAWDFTLDESIVLAYQNRAELEQELVNRNLAEQRRINARAAQRPNLTTVANYNVLGILSDNSDPFADQGWADGYSIQLQMRWNFFDGGLAKANARQQEINIAIAEERYSELRNDIRLEVESAFYDLQATFENIGVANLGVEEATEALRLARLRFQAGVGTQLDVINQETDLTRAQNQLLQAIIGYNRSLSRLHRAVSNLPGNNLQDTP